LVHFMGVLSSIGGCFSSPEGAAVMGRTDDVGGLIVVGFL